jgi:hypothetical protein
VGLRLSTSSFATLTSVPLGHHDSESLPLSVLTILTSFILSLLSLITCIVLPPVALKTTYCALMPKAPKPGLSRSSKIHYGKQLSGSKKTEKILVNKSDARSVQDEQRSRNVVSGE